MKLLWIAIAICSVTTVWAQDQTPPNLSQLSIEDLMNVKVETVYGASKFLEKTSDAPASITIITADEIQRYGYRTLAEALASVRGFYVIYDRNYTYLGLRGFSRPGDYNARILFFIDGHRHNDDIYDGSDVGTVFPLDMDLIDHIEIIRGPGSAVYGTGAVVAVINVVTRRGRDLNGWEASVQGGSWETYTARLRYGRRFNNGLETLVSGSFYNSAGHDRLFFPEFDSPATNNGVAVNADGDQYYNFFAEVIRGDFILHAVADSRTKHIPTASFGTVFNDPRTKTTDSGRYIDLQYAHSLQSKWDILARASYDWYGYRGIYIIDYTGLGIPPFTKNIDLASGDWSNFEFDASRLFHGNHVTIGAEFRDDFRQHQENYNQEPYQLYLDNTASRKNAAYYLQDNYRVTKKLSLVGALRSDWYEEFGVTYSPRLGAVFTPKSGTHFKMMYNRAFRAPNRYEQFYQNVDVDVSNPYLHPERISSYEFEFDQEMGKTISLTTSAFANNLDQLITPEVNSAGNLEFLNADYQRTRGLELDLSGHWGNGIQGDVSYSFQNSYGPTFVTNSPHNLGKARMSMPLSRRRFSVSVEDQYYSRMSTISGPVLGGYGTFNATLLARYLGGNLDLSANVENLFDKRYADSGGLGNTEVSIPQDGRSIRLGITYRSSKR